MRDTFLITHHLDAVVSIGSDGERHLISQENGGFMRGELPRNMLAREVANDAGALA